MAHTKTTTTIKKKTKQQQKIPQHDRNNKTKKLAHGIIYFGKYKKH
jgi:hypothetical protein